MTRRILLISSSTCHPTGYLDHAEPEIRDFLGGTRRVLFFPWALRDCDAYAAKVRERLGRMGFEVDSAHKAPDPVPAVEDAEAVFVCGGNTFRLLKKMYELDLLVPLRRRVWEGMPYVGSSAGSNVAGATIRSTNDMPILEPPSLAALAIVPFNLNPPLPRSRPDFDPQGRDPGGTDCPVPRGERPGRRRTARGSDSADRGRERNPARKRTGTPLSKGGTPAEFDSGDRLDFLLVQK